MSKSHEKALSKGLLKTLVSTNSIARAILEGRVTDDGVLEYEMKMELKNSANPYYINTSKGGRRVWRCADTAISFIRSVGIQDMQLLLPASVAEGGDE